LIHFGTSESVHEEVLLGLEIDPKVGQTVQLSSSVLNARPCMAVIDSMFWKHVLFLDRVPRQDRGLGVVTAVRNGGRSCMVQFFSTAEAEFFFNTGPFAVV
jgi:hypothetical protein